MFWICFLSLKKNRNWLIYITQWLSIFNGGAVKKLFWHQNTQITNYNPLPNADRKSPFNQECTSPQESHPLLLTCHNPFFANFSITDCHTSVENSVVKMWSKQGKKLCKTMGSPERNFHSLEILTWAESRTFRERFSN